MKKRGPEIPSFDFPVETVISDEVLIKSFN